MKNEVLDEEDNMIDNVDNDPHDHVDSNLDEKYDINACRTINFSFSSDDGVINKQVENI